MSCEVFTVWSGFYTPLYVLHVILEIGVMLRTITLSVEQNGVVFSDESRICLVMNDGGVRDRRKTHHNILSVHRNYIYFLRCHYV